MELSSSSGSFIEPLENQCFISGKDQKNNSDLLRNQDFIQWRNVFEKKSNSYDALSTTQEKDHTLREQAENEIKQTTKEALEKEAFIDTMRIWVYKMLWIESNQEKNGAIDNFTKGIVDELIIWNYEFAVLIWETKWQVLLDALKQLMTLEWIQAVLKWIWASIWDLFTWNAYEKWKSVAELWLLFMWVWWAYKGTKMFAKWLKKSGKVVRKWVQKSASVLKTWVIAGWIILSSEASFVLWKVIMPIGHVKKQILLIMYK